MGDFLGWGIFAEGIRKCPGYVQVPLPDYKSLRGAVMFVTPRG